jgi:hypothetical protein
MFIIRILTLIYLIYIVRQWDIPIIYLNIFIFSKFHLANFLRSLKRRTYKLNIKNYHLNKKSKQDRFSKYKIKKPKRKSKPDKYYSKQYLKSLKKCFLNKNNISIKTNNNESTLDESEKITNVNVYKYDANNSKTSNYESTEKKRGKTCRCGKTDHLKITSKKCRFFGIKLIDVNQILMNEKTLLNNSIINIESNNPLIPNSCNTPTTSTLHNNSNILQNNFSVNTPINQIQTTPINKPKRIRDMLDEINPNPKRICMTNNRHVTTN